MLALLALAGVARAVPHWPPTYWAMAAATALSALLLVAVQRAATHRTGHWQLPFAGHVVLINPHAHEVADVVAAHVHGPTTVAVLVATEDDAETVARALEQQAHTPHWHLRVGCGFDRQDLALVQADRAAVVWAGNGYVVLRRLSSVLHVLDRSTDEALGTLLMLHSMRSKATVQPLTVLLPATDTRALKALEQRVLVGSRLSVCNT